MKRKQAAPAPTVNECSQCTTPQRCGRQDLSGARGPRCVGRADGLDDCDCLNGCGDDPWLAKGKARPCERRRQEEAAAEFRATAGPAEYASWFPIGVHVPRAKRMPVERIAMLWNSLPLETDAESVVTFVRAIEGFHGIGAHSPLGRPASTLLDVDRLGMHIVQFATEAAEIAALRAELARLARPAGVAPTDGGQQ